MTALVTALTGTAAGLLGFVACRALELVRPDFAPATWAAFTRFVLDGRPAPEVVRELGVSANAVYLARNRVLTRVREELAGLLDRPRFEAMSFARSGQKARDSHDPIHAARDLRAGVRAACRVRGRGRPAP